MVKVGTLDVVIENLPDLINSIYPNNNNMSGLASRLSSTYKDIYQYIGVGSVFMRNHFKHSLLKSDGTADLNSNSFFNPLMEGLWHLHVAWSLRQTGFTLVKSVKDDDIVIELNGQKVAFEVTLSDININYLEHLSNDKVVKRMINVAKKKDLKIRKRSSGIPTIIVLNEQRVINDGFRLYGTQNAEYTKRVNEFNNKLQDTNLNSSVGVIYSNIKYDEYFAKNIFPTPILIKGVKLDLKVN